jgi:hypothetical protein
MASEMLHVIQKMASRIVDFRRGKGKADPPPSAGKLVAWPAFGG